MIRTEQRAAQQFRQLPLTNRRESDFLFSALDSAGRLLLLQKLTIFINKSVLKSQIHLWRGDYMYQAEQLYR